MRKVGCDLLPRAKKGPALLKKGRRRATSGTKRDVSHDIPCRLSVNSRILRHPSQFPPVLCLLRAGDSIPQGKKPAAAAK
jgi:hypothetical protein